MASPGYNAIQDNIYDCHVHLFDPQTWPYRPDRAYTPPKASATELIERSVARNFMIVQATIEDGSDSLLHHLNALRREYPARIFRGTILYGIHDHSDATAWSEARLRSLHEAGIRCLRIHGKFGSLAKDDDALQTIKTLLKSAYSIAELNGWAISMQLPLLSWAALADFLEREMSNIPVIAEHCASVNVPLTSADIAAFETVCTMLDKKVIYVKLGALHRRASSLDTKQLLNKLSCIAKHGDGQLLWGSDWPHVNSDVRGAEQADFLKVDEVAELELMRSSIEKYHGTFEKMLTATPARLFS